MKKEDKLEKEIEYIQHSMELDKFDYSLHISLFIANITLLTSILIVLLTIGLNPSSYSLGLVIISILCWGVSVILLRGYYDKKKFNSIGYEFRLKRLMLMDRYFKLKINPKIIQNEFDFFKRRYNPLDVLKNYNKIVSHKFEEYSKNKKNQLF